jgi:4'-phosphopantetheinyl transferase
LELPPITIELDEAQVWSLPLDDSAGLLPACERILAKDELARADRFITEQLRRRFIICRGCLRMLLAAATNQPAAELEFHYEQWGKPQLVGKRGGPLAFNVAHSHDHALIALGPTPLGVDLELPNPRIHPRAIVSQVTHPTEQTALERLPVRLHDAEILRLWVCKEALLKALGLGIAEGLQRTAFPMPIPSDERFAPAYIDAGLAEYIDDDGTCRSAAWIDAQAWRLQMLQPLKNCFAAIAVQRSIRHVHVKDWTFFPG